MRLLGATPAEQGAFATARDRIADGRAARPRAATPRQLPLDGAGFVGREEELAALDGTALTAVVGTAGVGKTALAVRWAHRAAARFPDGQLYVDLRGFDRQRPVAAAEALGGFLRALGVDGGDVPRAEAERAALYRTLVAGRRLLVVLDNASGADHVRPLLPGTATCTAVVTSRDDLTGLVVREGARRVRLEPLGPAAATRLLRTLLGEEADVAAIVSRCAGLPLALRIAAELDDLGGFDTGDPRTAVRTVFSWSYRHLGPRERHVFARFGLHPGPDLDGAAAGDPAALAALVRAHLVTRTGADRYAMHDLLRAYAAETLPAGEQRAALTRLLEHYLALATAAGAALFPHDVAGRPAPGGADAARRTLDRERANLVALAGLRTEHAIGLSRALWRYFEVGGHGHDALAVHGAAVHAALAGREGAAQVMANLAGTYWWLGEHARARDWFERALAWHERSGDRAGRARARARLGLAHERLGDCAQARACLVAALAEYRLIGDRHGEGSQLLNLGGLHRRLGHYGLARRHLRAAATRFAELGDARLEGYALGNLGALESLVGRHEEALDQLRRALAACRSVRDRGGEGSALAALSAALLRLGRPAEAAAGFEQALAISRETGERGLHIEALNGLGDALQALGRNDRARHRYRTALDLARRAGDPHEAARAEAGLTGRR
ncbi:tetratricopeptide repeat protein [Dactylosporangium vinaceum]|uniref:Tetratricopeptide repeat protein n=1 Tax=Dactylosporangium vinaceum TaxID=53362 RepID=A0ABV5MJP6_9ACTN|nr:tetratricopeptide repeat protein [Dactylosporangium vinaceum]UAB92645.1 tetratricopeptide repeat protein [Dactylosporangium vinaceum]